MEMRRRRIGNEQDRKPEAKRNEEGIEKGEEGMKSVLIIGLGRFGARAAEKLWELGHQIMVVDRIEARVDAVMSYATSGQIGDSTNRNFLESLGIPNFDFCIVSIGDDFQNSLETTSLLKELGAQKVVSRAASAVHAKFLKRNGADDVVFPEEQLAVWTAIRHSSEHVFGYFPVDQEYAIFEVEVPEGWFGKSVGDLNIRKNMQINILGVKRNGVTDMNISPETRFSQDETVLVLGKQENIRKYFRM